MVYSMQEGDENDGRNIFAVDGKNCGIDRKKRRNRCSCFGLGNMKHGDILLRLKEMEEKNWLVTYEIDMCCGEEYIVDGLTDAGKAALAELKK